MKALDADQDVTKCLKFIISDEYDAVGRYYSSNPQKRLTKNEALAISTAGLQIFTVFEDGARPALTKAAGQRDAKIALKQATDVGQPKGTAIYFALDSELDTEDLPGVRAYFSGVSSIINGAYLLGVYGDGVVCDALLSDGACQHAWLSASRGFPGSKQYYSSKKWSLAQDPNIDEAYHGLSIDNNEINGDFGAFSVKQAAQVAARAASPATDTPWMDWMRRHRGEVQQTGAKPTAFTEEIFSHTSYGALNGFTPESCAATVCAALEETGYRSTKSAAAKSYVTYGTACDLKPGCIVVFQWPDGGHHVDFCDEIVDASVIRGLGGNQGHALQDSNFLRKFIIATRWPVIATAAKITNRRPQASRPVVDYSHMPLGKRHARHDPRVPMLAAYLPLAALPAPPDSVDWFSDVDDWGMMQNDVLGDCTCAAVGHTILQWTTYTKAPRRLSDDDVVKLYEAVGGYNPENKSTDQGAVEVDVLNHWLNQGVNGDMLAAYASIEVGNVTAIKDAIHWFGNVYIGLALPLSAQTQDVWSVPPGGAAGLGAPGSWGGHAVPVVGYDQRGLLCVTWGQLKRMTYQFWSAYCDEAYALLSRDFIETSNTTPDGVNWTQLQADMQSLKVGYSSAQLIKHL
ncbi:glycoside hydrolase domain-containing protein [Bradyrhizobium erythrophlei]|uniref:Rv2525c-like glycoside hydrolase-like domain-containing protein n=1 Tax=Bradyrhizobium erythrophlei TaxID=1437360 RepID=A0A1M7TRV7_9BRAD|nr:glycoside hydrolase domain-containing protein [Bradyrhizobium erythrophlei]SHN73472.1 protein of unknown function [Bradyrhizobium erythrophlei]